jgi:hypothetical protein
VKPGLERDVHPRVIAEVTESQPGHMHEVGLPASRAEGKPGAFPEPDIEFCAQPS